MFHSNRNNLFFFFLQCHFILFQISDFNSAKADFGTELAISTRTELDPGDGNRMLNKLNLHCLPVINLYLMSAFSSFLAAWWQQHGINCLELQRIAVRILSQTCSSFGCEHNWSTYDQIHRESHNRLAQKRLNDLIYVHYNLRLRERQLSKRSNDVMSLDSILLESLLDDWIVEAENPTVQEDEVSFKLTFLLPEKLFEVLVIGQCLIQQLRV